MILVMNVLERNINLFHQRLLAVMKHRTNIIYWEALNEIEGVTPYIFRKLLNYFENPYFILYEANERELLEVLNVMKERKR